VSLLVTAHASSMEELVRRPTWRKLVEWKVFERVIILGRSLGPGTLERVVNGIDGSSIFEGPVR